MGVRDKIYRLKDEGYSDRDIIENIFLNYESKYEKDLIYKIKKEISRKLEIDINSIKLVGSAHSGVKKKETLEEKEDPGDLDFAIVDCHYFSKFLEKIKKEDLVKSSNLRTFQKNLFSGKLHLLYLKNNEIFDLCSDIQTKFSIEKKISICIYLSETLFLNNLEEFFGSVITDYYRERYQKLDEIKEIKTGVKELKKWG